MAVGRSDSEIVIGIDYGTTYTGISWSWSNDIERTRIDCIDHWLTTPVNRLDRENHGNHWGFGEVSRGFEKYAWAKLLLDQDTEIARPGDSGPREMHESIYDYFQAIETAQGVVENDIHEIHQHMLQQLEPEHDAEAMRKIAVERRVTATHSIQQLLPRNRLARKTYGHSSSRYRPLPSSPAYDRQLCDSGDTTIMCDCSGGTMDIVSYKVLPNAVVNANVAVVRAVKPNQFESSEFDAGDNLVDCDGSQMIICPWIADWPAQVFARRRKLQKGLAFGEELDMFDELPRQKLLGRGFGYISQRHEPKSMKISDPFTGDEGFGLNFGEPDMSREDDDDDDCVGFRGCSGHCNASNVLIHPRGRRRRVQRNHVLWIDQSSAIPKLGPPKRDPVAAAMHGPTLKRPDDSTLNIWRDAIARTCAGKTGIYGVRDKNGERCQLQELMI